MAHGTRINGTSYGITGGKCLVGGTAYRIQKGRTLVEGTGYDITFGTPLDSYAEGTSVYINENGVSKEYFIAKHNYEPTLNGNGATLICRKTWDFNMKFDDSSSVYDGCDIDNFLSNQFFGMLDSGVQNKLINTVFKSGTGNLQRKIFIFSANEALGSGGDGSYIQTIEQKISFSFSESIWTRTAELPFRVYAIQGQTFAYPPVSDTRPYIIPMFCLPGSTIVGDGNLIT